MPLGSAEYAAFHVIADAVECFFGRPVPPAVVLDAAAALAGEPAPPLEGGGEGEAGSAGDPPPLAQEEASLATSSTATAFFALDEEDTVACAQCEDRARERGLHPAALCPVTPNKSLVYLLPIGVPWGTVPVLVEIFLRVETVSVSVPRLMGSSRSSRGPVTPATSRSSAAVTSVPPHPPFSLFDPVTDSNSEAKQCALILFKAWKLDNLPGLPSHHVFWAVTDATKIAGINFEGRPDLKRSPFSCKVHNIFRAAVLRLCERYRDVSQPSMFRRDFGSDTVMLAHGDALHELWKATLSLP